MILETLIGALVPVAAEGVKGAVSKFFGGGIKPTTIEDQVRLDAAEIDKLKAIAALDNPGGTPSQWVIDLRASARYVTAGVVILGSIIAMFTSSIDPATKITALEGANVVFGFLFGSRIVAAWRK